MPKANPGPAAVQIVTAAIIFDPADGRILIAKRKPENDGEGFWEFPGGSLEPGETPQDCLRRELKEEFGIDARVDRFFAASTWSGHSKEFELQAYWTTHIAGEYRLLAHDEILWVKPDEMRGFSFGPADIPIVEKLMKGD